MGLTKKQETQLNNKIKDTLKNFELQGMKIGAVGILGAILDMCNDNIKTDAKIIEDIKDFCEKSLNLNGMK